MRFGTWIRCRPIIGMFIPSGTYKLEPKDHYYIVRHPLGHAYLRDPYRIRANAGDPRSDWADATKAWRFSTESTALHAIQWQGWDGTVIRVAASPANRTA